MMDRIAHPKPTHREKTTLPEITIPKKRMLQVTELQEERFRLETYCKIRKEFAEDNPGRCFAVYAGPGDVVIVPPYWVHATISANPTHPLTFGAWCDREYGFVYDGVRKHNGIAWYPVFDEQNKIRWMVNPSYQTTELTCKSPSGYDMFGIEKGKSIYQLFEEDPDTFLFVPSPQLKAEQWKEFVP